MIDTDCVMVMGPYAAESSAITSPPAITCAIAAVKPRQGRARLQGLTSLPYEATKVRWARPKAGGATSAPSNRPSVKQTVRDRGVDIRTSLILGSKRKGLSCATAGQGAFHAGSGQIASLPVGAAVSRYPDGSDRLV